jgi:hypothetical protein
MKEELITANGSMRPPPRDGTPGGRHFFLALIFAALGPMLLPSTVTFHVVYRGVLQ